MAEAALCSVFMKALAWCQTASFGFKPSFFQVQSRAELLSACLANSTHSGRWARQRAQWGLGEMRLGRGHSRRKRHRLSSQGYHHWVINLH